MALQERLFVWVGQRVSRLPRFRGRNRACLMLFNALGLKDRHTLVQAELSAPISYRAKLDLHSWLQRIAFLDGEYEANTVAFLLKLHEDADKPGFVLDIGGNVGLIALPTALSMAAAGAMQRPCVVSVEAVPDNAAALRGNIELNGAGNLVTVIDKALGDQPGSFDIQVEGDLARGEGTGTANILPSGSVLDPNGTYKCVRIPIEVTTLDLLYRAGQIAGSCTVIKIDTDGYDLKVLQGGAHFLKETRPVIYGEFSAHCLRWHGQGIDDVKAFADAINYVLWQRVKSTGPIKFSQRLDSAEYSQDLLLVPRERAQALNWCCV